MGFLARPCLIICVMHTEVHRRRHLSTAAGGLGERPRRHRLLRVLRRAGAVTMRRCGQRWATLALALPLALALALALTLAVAVAVALVLILTLTLPLTQTMRRCERRWVTSRRGWRARGGCCCAAQALLTMATLAMLHPLWLYLLWLYLLWLCLLWLYLNYGLTYIMATLTMAVPTVAVPTGAIEVAQKLHGLVDAFADLRESAAPLEPWP